MRENEDDTINDIPSYVDAFYPISRPPMLTYPVHNKPKKIQTEDTNESTGQLINRMIARFTRWSISGLIWFDLSLYSPKKSILVPAERPNIREDIPVDYHYQRIEEYSKGMRMEMGSI